MPGFSAKCNLALNPGIPTVLFHGPQVRWHGKIGSVRPKLRILFVIEKRVRITARIIRPRIVKADPATNNRQTKRRNRRLVLNENLWNEILGDPGAQAERGFSIPKRIPGNCQPRIDFLFRRDSRLTVEAGIARIGEARVRIRYNGASLTGEESVEAEIVQVAMFERHRDERFPTQAVVQRQLGSHLPCILCVQTIKILSQIFGVRVGLTEKSNTSEEEVGHAGPGQLAVELKGRNSPRIGHVVQAIADRVSSKGKLMGAANDADVIVNSK